MSSKVCFNHIIIIFVTFTECASRPDMRNLSNLVTPKYASEWMAIGEFLGLESGTLNIIDKDHPKTEDKCNGMLQKWLDTKTDASWDKIITAIDDAIAQIGTPKVLKIVKEMSRKKRFEASEDDWPPYQPETYTTVALIHYDDKLSFESGVIAVGEIMYKREITTPSSTANGSDNEAKGSHNQEKQSGLSGCSYIRNVSEIFSVVGVLNKPVNYTLLIEGAPGIGKTTLTKEIAFLWAEGRILKNIKLLISISLRDPFVHKISNFIDLAQYILSICHTNETTEKFACYLSNTFGEDIMCLLDGYDEFPESLQQSSFIADMINHKVFPCSKVVVTSRPSASAHLCKKAEYRIEILGFTDEDRRVYISQAFQNDPEKIEKTFLYLENNPGINSLCYIPLNMCILICLLKGSAQNDLPQTQTDINNQFTCMTISRYFLREEKKKIEISSLFSTPEEHMGQLKELAKLAFDLLTKDKVIFNYHDIENRSLIFSKNLNGMGLLKAVKHINIENNCIQVSFHFLHFSFQEFLAAFHIASSSDADQTRIMPKIFWNDRYRNMWIMYFGLTKGNSPPLVHFLSGKRFFLWFTKFKFRSIEQGVIDEEIVDSKIKCLHLFHCFSEAGNEAMCQKIGNFFSDTIIDLSGQLMTPIVMHTLSFFLTRYIQKEWEALNLSNCSINNESINALLKSCLSDQANKLSIKVLDISFNCIAPSSLQDICKLVIHLKAQKLVIHHNNVSTEDISTELFNIAFSNNNSTFCLSLTVVSSQGKSNNVSSSFDGPCDSKSFEDTTSLYMINCEYNQLLRSKDYFSHVDHLFLWNSDISLDNFKAIAEDKDLLISIVHTSMHDDMLTCLQSEFQKYFTLKAQALKVKGNLHCILKSRKQLFVCGADAQYYLLIFKKTFANCAAIQITNCPLTNEALQYIGNIISNNRICWEMVDLSCCNITDEGFAILCHPFPSHYSNIPITIKVFNLSCNCLTSLSVPIIMSSLKTCIVNQYILSDNNISHQQLSKLFTEELQTQFVSANFLQKYPLIMVNREKQVNTCSKLPNHVCNVYIVNCEIETSIFTTLLQKDWIK